MTKRKTIKKAKRIVIDADTARRMALNAESNPRARYDPVRPTDSGEATQTLNPITGRPYADGMFIPEVELRRIKNYFDDFYGMGKTNFEEIFTYDIPKKQRLRLLKPRTNDEIELQKALGRMGVREGRLGDLAYGEFLDEVERLADVYAQNPALTLDSITDVTGLNISLLAIERERMPEKYSRDMIYIEEKIKITSDLFSEINRTPFFTRGMVSQILRDSERRFD